MLYSCALCGKEYRSAKAHAQHLNSRTHVMRATQESGEPVAGITIIKPLTDHAPNKSTSFRNPHDDDESEESEDEWLEIEPNDDVDMASESLDCLHVDEPAPVSGADKNDDMDEDEEIDTSCCFVCDLKHDTIENCMIHIHKQHGFFIPDVEYLKDPQGLLTYVALKVIRDFMCLYCNDRCHPFQSLEAVRKHMIAKGHCKVRYGDGGDDEEAEFEEFYDYSSRYRSMGLATVKSREQMVRMKVVPEMNRRGVEAMRSKIGMRSNVIRNLPMNVPY